MTGTPALDHLCEQITARLGLGAQEAWQPRLEAIFGGLHLSDDRLDAMISQLAGFDLNTPLWQQIIASITIGETRFLRQRSWFQQIERLAILPLIRQRRKEGNLRLRFWSAGCSTGEEAYTLAILLRDLLPDIDDWQISILATDVRAEALQEAGQAEYNRRQLRELDDRQIAQYFTPGQSDSLKVAPDIRRLVTFDILNLADVAMRPLDDRRGSFDLVICRNVLMYMTPEIQKKIANYLSAVLVKNGWLVVSPAESSADWFRSLTPVNAPEAILFTKASTAPMRASSQKIAGVAASVTHAQQNPSPRSRAAQKAANQPISLAELRSLADRRLLAEARSRCQDLLAADRLNCDASMLLAEICLELDDPSSAVEAARQAVYLAPLSAMAHYLLAGALGRLGRIARAQSAMRTAFELANAADADTPAAACSDITHQQIRNAASAFLSRGTIRSGRVAHGWQE